MTLITSILPFSPCSYLSRRQQIVYGDLPSKLHVWIENRLLASESSEGVTCAKLIVDIVLLCKRCEEETVAAFFMELVQIEGCRTLQGYFSRLLSICKEGGSVPFFSCITSKKIDYYPACLLLEIIDGFYAIVQAKQPLGALANFPPYEEGGEELLNQLKNDPSLVNRLNGGQIDGSPSHVGAVKGSKLADLLESNCVFAEMHSLAIRYVSSLNEDQRASSEVYLRIFRALSKGTASDITKVILTKLILLLSTKEAGTYLQAKTYTVDDFGELLEEAEATQKHWGEEVLLLFCSGPSSVHAPSLTELIHILALLNSVPRDHHIQSQVGEMLARFSSGLMYTEQLTEGLENLWVESGAGSMIQTEAIEPLLKRFAGNDNQVQYPIPDEFIHKIGKQFETVEKLCQDWKHLPLRELIKLAAEIRTNAKQGPLADEDLLRLVAIGRLGLYIKFHKYPYSTQVLTVLGQFCYPCGAIGQVKTGEGKSLIIGLLAFVLAMQDKSVHIISSGRNLSIRDQQEGIVFFKAFGVSTSHICCDDPKPSQFQAQILYGSASDFEFAIMREMLHFTPLLQQQDCPGSNKRFDSVIVDELDNLTIDTAANSARLSYPAAVTYDWVYVPILQFVKEHCTKERRADLLLPNALAQLRSSLEAFAGGKYQEVIPQLTDEKLLKWVNFARRAFFDLEEWEDYVVLENKSGSRHQQRKIVVVDAQNTGRLMHGCRWSGGLHEFVEVKHHLFPERESLTPISLNHSVFYPLYRSLYGFTGTLGSLAERGEIQEIYGSDSFDVPTYRPSCRIDYSPVIFPTDQAYFFAILQQVVDCRSHGRPILILCETIKDSQLVGNLLSREGISSELLNEMQEKSENEILAVAGRPGVVTIATNTAGRGTDIILPRETVANGGLHVLLTFFPESLRVEFQARGRAGRQGQPGSSAIVLSAERLDIPSHLITPSNISSLIAKLDEQRIAQGRIMKRYHLGYAELERYRFTFVKKFYEFFGKFNNAQVKGIVTHLAESLSKRKLLRLPQNGPSALSSQDKRFALQALELLTNKNTEQTKWKVLLEEAGERVKEKMLNHWSLNFHDQAEDLLKVSSMQILATQLEAVRDQVQSAFSSVLTEEALQGLLDQLEKPMLETQQEKVAELKLKMKDLFEQYEAVWRKYLDPSGSGIVHFLREITGASLKGL